MRAAGVADGDRRWRWRCRRRWRGFVVGGTAAIDLVLVVVVYVALTSGPVTGLLAGTVAGLMQDALSSGVIGIGGLARRSSGFSPASIGTQFIVTAAAAAVRGVLRRDACCTRSCSWGCTCCSDLRQFRRRRTRRSPARRSATRWSASWRSRWSSCCLERWSGDGATVDVRPDPELERSAESMAIAEDRRRHHDPADRAAGTASSSCSPCSAISFWVLQVVQHAKFEEMAENNHQRTLALRAPRGVRVRPQRPGAGREPPLVQHLDRPRAHQGSQSHDPAAGRGRRRSTKHACARSSSAIAASRRYRPIVVVAGRDAGAGRGGHRAALDFELPDVVVEQVPTRQYPGDDWRRTCSATSARSATRRSPTTTA